MRYVPLKAIFMLPLLLLAGCGSDAKKPVTVADLSITPIDYPLASTVSPERLHAIEQYQTYLQKSEFKTHYGEALRRVADLELEVSEEQRHGVPGAGGGADEAAIQAIKLSSIEHYNTYLRTYPGHEKNDLIFYQLAKAYALVGEMDKAMQSMDAIVKDYPQSRHIDEVQFRRGEILFVNRDFEEAEKAYGDIVTKYQKSPLYEKALYKLGWSQFKQSHYEQTLQTYLVLLDIKESEKKIGPYGISSEVNKSEKDFIIDSLRAISLSLSYLEGYKTIPGLFRDRGEKLYKPLIYEQLGNLYADKERYNDAADVFMAYTAKHPMSVLSPGFHSMALKVYADGKINHKVLDSKMLYVKKYGVGSAFWKQQTADDQNRIRPDLMRHIRELSLHFHAQARKSKKQKDFKVAASWYEKFLRSFPGEKEAAGMNFLYAEALHDAGLYAQALAEYEKSAYKYPKHGKSAEAGYAALLTYSELLKQASDKTRNKASNKASNKDRKKRLSQLRQQSLESSIRFSNTFPDDKHTPAVVTKTAENLLQAKDYVQAAEFSRRIIDSQKILPANLLRTAWIVYAHTQYELSQYANAENAYTIALNRLPRQNKARKDKSNMKLRAELIDKLAASIYKQAEVHRARGENKLAAFHFMRVGKVAPSSSIRTTAEYDAATLYIGMKDWQTSSTILENMRRSPSLASKLAQGISGKLVFVYSQLGQFDKAARELNTLSGFAKTPEDHRNLSWQAAEMYEKAGKTAKANDLYVKYIKKYPRPFLQSIEAYSRVTAYYKGSRSAKQRDQWLKRLIVAEKRGGKLRTDRSRYLAAEASLELAQPVISRYKQVRLTLPLKKSLRTKKQRMESAIAALKKVMAYKVAEFSTASTYQMGEIYNNLASSLMKAQRPKGLSGDELEQYEILLEEQAYPFEEKSIDIHSLNAKRTKLNIYDEWVKKSMAVLRKIQPVRYAKHEKIESYVLITH
ncbi:TPR domain protein, putative component of TonB system [hydrothermal vent metagenome]|uniref:TPR domain protein, putative component of TonB system n=1 Tax=hydrothermal vent metagenome TaxID=652676 RepID=A0A3B0XIA0_9ZZZZ